jgi:hypothetical protein
LAATRTPIGAELPQNSHLSDGTFGFFGSSHSVSDATCISDLAQSLVVKIGRAQVMVRFVGRKGRRGRIVIEAPAGATFSECGSLADGRNRHSTLAADDTSLPASTRQRSRSS